MAYQRPLIAALLLATIAGCGSKPNGLPVEYVVPDAYHGVFSVTLDPTSGQKIPITNGHYIVAIPASGKLAVSSFDFFQGKHVISARSQSNPDTFPPGHNPNSISLRLVDYDIDTKTVFWLIGTDQEAQDASKKRSRGTKI